MLFLEAMELGDAHLIGAMYGLYYLGLAAASDILASDTFTRTWP